MAISRLNPHVAEVWTVTFGGTEADGNYDFYVKETAAATGTLVRTTRTGGAPATNALLGDACAVVGEALTALANVVSFVSDGAGVVTVTALHRNDIVILDGATAPTGATLVLANTVQPTGTTFGAGRVLAQSATEDEIRALTSTDTSANVAGISQLSADMLDNTGVESDLDGYAPGTMIPLNLNIPIWMYSETAATQGGAVYVRRVAGTGENLGDVRASGAGTARVETATPTPANSTEFAMAIEVDPYGNGDWKSYTIGMVSDASATATEICTGLKASLAAITELTGVITGSGTATFIMTGAAGVSFRSRSIGPGVIAVAETTAGTFETFVLKGARFENTIAAAGLVKVRPNLTPAG
jgi:hypothetical protein